MSIRCRKTKHGCTYQVYFPCKSCSGGVYRKGGFQSKSEAKNHEALKKAELLDNGYIKKEVKMTVNEVFDEFISVADSDFQYNSIEGMKRRKKYFENGIGRMMINEVRYIDVQRYFDSRKNEGLSVNKKIYNALFNTFKHARRCEYTKNNPMEDVKVRGCSLTEEKTVVSKEDFDRLIEAFQKKKSFKYNAYVVALCLGFYLGLRISEVFALEKNDFDLEMQSVNITKKMNYKGLRVDEIFISKHLKSKASAAILFMPRCLTEILGIWFQENPYDRVICDEYGKYLHPDCFSNSLRKIAKELDIKITFHTLRHTFATNCEKNGVQPKEAQMLLRHASFDTTLTVYTHIDEQRKRDAINKAFSSFDSSQ